MKLTASLVATALALSVPAFAQKPDLDAIQLLIFQGRAAEAKPLAQAAAQAAPQDARAQDILGQALTRAEQPDAAIAALTAAATLDPKSAAIQTHLGDAQIARFMLALRELVKKRGNDMLGAVHSSVPTASPDVGMYGPQGSLLDETNINDRSSSQINDREWQRMSAMAEAARDAYGKALAIAPADRRATRGRGLAQLILGQWKDTVTAFQAAGVPPFDPFIYDVVSNVHDGHSMGEQSIRLWEMVAASEPLNGWAYWNLRNLYNEFHRGDWHYDYYNAMRMLFASQISDESDARRPTVKDALKGLNALTAEHGSEAIVWRGLGLANAMNKDKKAAEAAYKKAAELDPKDWYSQYQVGAYRLAANDAAAAQLAFTAAAAQRPDDAIVWMALGDAAEKAKDLDTAQNAYERACEIAPAYDKAQFNAGALLLDRRMGAEALPHLERYLLLAPKAKDADQIREAVRQVKEILAKQGQ